MDFKFDLQLFAAVDFTGDVTVKNGSGETVTTSTLWVTTDGTVWAVKPNAYAAVITLKAPVSSPTADTAIALEVTKIEETGAVTAGFTLKAGDACVISDTTGTNTHTLAGTALQGKAFSVASDKTITNFDSLYADKPVTLEGSGTVKFGDTIGAALTVKASDLKLTTLDPTAGAVTAFGSGTLEVPAGTTAFTLMSADLKGLAATYKALTTNDAPYIEATFAGNGVTASFDGADVPFHAIGTSYADTFTTSKGNADTIVSGAGNDTISVASTKAVSIDGGAGNDSIKGTAATATNEATILGGDGNDIIEFTKATSTIFDGGDGNDKITLAATVTKSTVLGGSGSDTLSSADATNVLTGGDGADYFGAGNGENANISDYNYSEDFIATGATDLADAVAAVYAAAGTGFKSDGNVGMIAVGNTKIGNATIGGSDSAFAVKMVATNKDKLGVGWVGANATSINASDDKDAVILIGTTNSEGDTLVGGSKADTILAGVNDSVYGGAGSDSVSVGTNAYGVFVGLSTASGADTVSGFIAGWDTDTADSVLMLDGSAESLKGSYDGTNVSLKSGSATLTFTGMTGSATAKTTDDAKVLISGKKVDFIKKGSLVAVTDDSTFADYYFGTEASGIDMTSYTGDVEVNLSNEMFRNIATVKAGSGNMSVLGGKSAEYLVGGAGATSLYGGAGTDTLVSGKGVTTFFADANSGKDVVTGFVVGSGDDADVLNVSSIKSVSRSDDKNFVLNVDDKNSLKVTQASGDVNSNIQWVSGDASGVAKIGKAATANKFSYDAATTNYIGSTKIDTVSIASGTTDSFNVWLDKTGGTFSSIEVYDFSQTSGDVLAAGKADTAETIVAGKGISSLWGGAGNTKDVLQNKNSSATTEFFYGLGEGNDVIEGKSDDSVNLYNISVSDITKATINSNNVVFTTTANNTVTVSGSVGTFKLADGSSWKADYSKKTWVEGN